MKRPAYIIILISITIVILAVIRITVVNSISTTGSDLKNLQNQISVYQKENILLKKRYLEATALGNIEKKAKKLGFAGSSSPIYLSAPIPLAMKQ
jgi:cell division protein FtsL